MTPPLRKKKGTFEIGVNLRVTQCFDKGGRNYMEDFSKYYFEKDAANNQSVIFAFFGVFDGHGGTEAAELAHKRLLDEIKSQEEFWSHDDNDVLQAIRQGFLKTHEKMVDEREKWPLTPSGFQSTAGTTASIAIIRNRKLYVGHVGDSAVVIGCCSSDSKDASTDNWGGTALTVEHKPDHPEERKRIEAHGGSVRRKAGIHRVVWNRPKTNKCVTATASSTPVQMAAEYEEIPFLAVARSLGDLWSFDPETGEFHVSPEPDICVYELRPTEHRCLIIGSDGLWNVIKPETAVELVRLCERETESRVFSDPSVSPTFFYHPAGTLVQYALERCLQRGVRADNVTALVIMIDPPGKPMTQLRLERRRLLFSRLGLEDKASAGSGNRESVGQSACDVSNIRRLLVESQRAVGRDASSSPTVAGGGDNGTAQKSGDNAADVPHPTENDKAEGGPPGLRTVPPANQPRALPPLCILRNTLQGPSGFPTLVEAWSEPCWRDMLAYCKQTGLADATSGEMDAQRLLDHLIDMDAKYRKEALQAVPTVLSMKRAFHRDHEMSVCLGQIPLLSREWTQLLVMSSSNPTSPTSPPTSGPAHIPQPSSLGPPSPPACRRWLERRDKILNHLYQMLGRKLPGELSKDAEECMRAHVAREVSQRIRVSRPCENDIADRTDGAGDSNVLARRSSAASPGSKASKSQADVDGAKSVTREETPVIVKSEPGSPVVARTRRQRRLTANGPAAEPEQRSPASSAPVTPAQSKKPALRRVIRGNQAADTSHLILPTESPTLARTHSGKTNGGSQQPQPTPLALTNHVSQSNVAKPVSPALPGAGQALPDAFNTDVDAENQNVTSAPPTTNTSDSSAEVNKLPQPIEAANVVPWRSRTARRKSTSALYPEEKAQVDHLMEKLVVVVTPDPEELMKVNKQKNARPDATGPPKPRPVLLPRSRAMRKRQRKSDSDLPKEPPAQKAAVVLPQDYKKSYKAFFKKVIVDATAEARLEEVMRSVTYRTADPKEVTIRQRLVPNAKPSNLSPSATTPVTPMQVDENPAGVTDTKTKNDEGRQAERKESVSPTDSKRRRLGAETQESGASSTGRRSLRLRVNKE